MREKTAERPNVLATSDFGAGGSTNRDCPPLSRWTEALSGGPQSRAAGYGADELGNAASLTNRFQAAFLIEHSADLTEHTVVNPA